MTRTRLPARRRSMTFEIEQEGQRFAVCIGLYDDDQPGELFMSGAKVGSMLDSILDDASVAISLALQHGISPDALGRSMACAPCAGGSKPASVIGSAVDLLRGKIQ